MTKQFIMPVQNCLFDATIWENAQSLNFEIDYSNSVILTVNFQSWKRNFAELKNFRAFLK